MRSMIRRTVALIILAATAGLSAGAAAQGHATTICDALATTVRSHVDSSAEAGGAFSVLTGGPSPAIQIAVSGSDGKNVSLERNPAADTRIQFEKRFRAEFGEAPVLVRELRNWDALDVVTLPGDRLHMVLSTSGADLCESRIFFRTTAIREGERLPDPPAGPDGPVCQGRGGWGFLARINIRTIGSGGIDAFLEYRLASGRESFRIVPLTDDGWQAACTFTAPYRSSSPPSPDRFPTRP